MNFALRFKLHPGLFPRDSSSSSSCAHFPRLSRRPAAADTLIELAITLGLSVYG